MIKIAVSSGDPAGIGPDICIKAFGQKRKYNFFPVIFGDREIFEPLVSNLINHDPFCVFADFSDYLDAQDRVSRAWTNRDAWNRMSLLNIAKSGFFSSDRSIKDYCTKIWGNG